MKRLVSTAILLLLGAWSDETEGQQVSPWSAELVSVAHDTGDRNCRVAIGIGVGVETPIDPIPGVFVSAALRGTSPLVCEKALRTRVVGGRLMSERGELRLSPAPLATVSFGPQQAFGASVPLPRLVAGSMLAKSDGDPAEINARLFLGTDMILPIGSGVVIRVVAVRAPILLQVREDGVGRTALREWHWRPVMEVGVRTRRE